MESTSVERYCSRLQQLGLEPLILKRIKASLILAFKMIFSLLPTANIFFQPLCLDTAGSSVAGSTRRAGALRAHPYPLQLAERTEQGWITGLSDKSFAFLVSKIWNDLPFDAAAYESVATFSLNIDKLDFSQIKFSNEMMGAYSVFFSTGSLALYG